MAIQTRSENANRPRVDAQDRRPDSLPASLLALGLCACVGSGGLLALLIVMVT